MWRVRNKRRRGEVVVMEGSERRGRRDAVRWVGVEWQGDSTALMRHK